MTLNKGSAFPASAVGILAGLFLLAACAAGGEAALLAQRSFTDSDLERYRAPRAGGTVPPAGATQTRPPETGASPDPKARTDRQQWCDMATRHREDIRQAAQDLGRAEEDERLANEVILYRKEINETTLGSLNKARDAAGEARQRLQSAEQALKILEEDARAKNIPPGWLECHFE